MAFEDISESQWNKSDLVMVSGMSAQQQDMLQVIKQAKKRDKKSWLGVHGLFMSPEQALEAGADLVLR